MGSVDFYAKIGSLIPTRFANSLGLVLASEIPVAPMPLPATFPLLMSGLGLVATLRRRQSSLRLTAIQR